MSKQTKDCGLGSDGSVETEAGTEGIKGSPASAPTSDYVDPYIRPIHRLITVEPALILYNMAFFASTPLQIQYIHHRLEQDLPWNFTNSTNGSGLDDGCGGTDSAHQDAVQKAGAFYLTIMTMFAIIPCLFTTLLVGAYSDKAGRKYALVPALCGEVFRVGVSIVVIWFRLSLWFFSVGLFAQGLVGGAGAVIMSCYSYMADVTTRSERGLRIFLLEVCSNVGRMVAQVAIGQSIAHLGYLWPYVAIFIIQTVTLLYVIFFLPETRNRRPDAKLFTFDHYKRAASLYFGPSMKGKRLSLGLGVGIMGFCTAANMVNNETITLYLVSRPLCWESILVGYYSALSLAVKLIGSSVILKLLMGRLHEAVLAMGSLVSTAGCDLVVGFATQTWIMFIAPFVGFGSEIADPMIRTITSKLVGPENQGALFASQSWMLFFSAMLGTLFFNSIYATSTSFHGLVFVVAALMYIIPFVCTTLLYRREQRPPTQESQELGINRDTGIDNPVWHAEQDLTHSDGEKTKL